MEERKCAFAAYGISCETLCKKLAWDRRHICSHHSKKLALACALINTNQAETVYITKNMRMCDDCHVATLLISKIEIRKIVITDA